MGVDKYPDYFPVSYKKDGSAKENYYSLSHFKTLSKIIDNKIIGMGESLHNGLIGAIPCGKDGEGKMCTYCSYKSICGIEKNDEINEITKLTHLKALERLDGEGNEQGMD
jgi:ATP-dependent helicase/DNAse subunit B